VSESSSVDNVEDRKIKILAVPANTGGCSYYRILMPLDKLVEKYGDQIEVKYNFNPLDWDEGSKRPKDDSVVSEDMDWADIVFTQNISNYGAKYMIDLFNEAKNRNKFIHYDTDDLLTDLYDGHRLEQVYKDNKLDQLTKILYHNADLVSVTQYKFAHRVSEFVRGTLVVIKNAIDFELPCWNLPKIKAPKKVCRIGWVGGIHHEQDVREIPTIAMSVNNKVGAERVHWGFYGRPPVPEGQNRDWQQDVWDNYQRILTGGIKHRNWSVYPAGPSNSYGAMFRTIDVTIAPLQWNNFNDSKSEIKLMEAGRYGLPLVATNCGCYDEIIVNGETGYLISKDNPTGEWVKYLSRLIKDKKHREEVGQNLRKIVNERFDINKHIHTRLELYQKLLNEKNKNKNNIGVVQ